MIKVRIKRVKSHNSYHFDHLLDHEFVNGFMEKLPKKEEGILFYFGKLDKGWWRTTPVQTIFRLKTFTLYRTLNSDYQLKKGWKK